MFSASADDSNYCVLSFVSEVSIVATLEQLRQETTKLRITAAAIGVELRQVLMEYFDRLKYAVQQQLVLSSFHLCTQVYPEAFLQISTSNRESLQRRIRQLGIETATTLAGMLQPLQVIDCGTETDPTALLEAWETIEVNITALLQDTSRHVNHLLQDGQVMQIKALDKLLATAVKAEATGRTVTNPPHLLKALVDQEEENEDDLDPVVAIYLQLGDLEFTDPELMSKRQRLRPLLQKLAQVQQTYAQKQEEQLTAEAIAAWKATWVSDGLEGGSMG
jgi:hypothetical protein